MDIFYTDIDKDISRNSGLHRGSVAVSTLKRLPVDNRTVVGMTSTNVTINDTTVTKVLETNANRVKAVIQLDCDPVKVCLFVKKENNTALMGEMLIKDFLSNQNLYVPRFVIPPDADYKGALYAIIDATNSDATTEMLHIVEYSEI